MGFQIQIYQNYTTPLQKIPTFSDTMKSDAPDNPVYEAALTCVETALQKDNRHGTPTRKRFAFATLFFCIIALVFINQITSLLQNSVFNTHESVMDLFMPNITEYIKIL